VCLCALRRSDKLSSNFGDVETIDSLCSSQSGAGMQRATQTLLSGTLEVESSAEVEPSSPLAGLSPLPWVT